jgi:branched-chain amino acid aminotransferase
MQVFLNGKFVPEKKAKVSVFDPGFRYGGGTFETLLVRDGEIQLLREHLQRLHKGAKDLKMKVLYADDKIIKIAKELVERNKIKKAMLRIVLTPETFLMHLSRFPERPKVARVCFVKMERCLPWLKTLNYLPTVLAQAEAEKRGFDEALLVNREGYVLEGGRTNFFWVKKGRLFTPPLGEALSGITRAKVIDLAKQLKIKFVEKKVKAKELLLADEIFLTNAPMEIWPVVGVEGARFAVGAVTKLLQEHYE